LYIAKIIGEKRLLNETKYSTLKTEKVVLSSFDGKNYLEN